MIYVMSDIHGEIDRWNRMLELAWEDAAGLESSTVCKYCGRAGKIRKDCLWYKTLCDRCDGVNKILLLSMLDLAGEIDDDRHYLHWD